MNKEQTFRGELEQGMSDCLKEVCNPYERDEQREQRIRLDLLKRWEISIHVLDRGCVVKVGCKSIAFVSIEAAYKEIGRYLENPQFMATQHGFEDHI